MSEDFKSESIINYYKNFVKPSLCDFLFIKDENIVDGIIVNARFELKSDQHKIPILGGTLLHIAAAVNDKIIVGWLINEKGADPNVKDHHDRDIYEISEAYNAKEVLEILPPKKHS
uniref:Ankyrin repeat domain-containing protein n=1 Tax=Panagrolaimus sp. ES5 TaxID=591445 RepID=A0AC34FRE6_9BILA